MSLYLQVLLESAGRASLIPLSNDVAIYAMKLFGGYNLPLAVTLAIVGGMTMQCVNLTIGYGLLRLKEKRILRVSDKAYDTAKRCFFTYYVFLLLLFGWAVGGSVLVVVAGFLGARAMMVLPLLFAGYIANYLIFLVS